jgi:hypothetical protein
VIKDSKEDKEVHQKDQKVPKVVHLSVILVHKVVKVLRVVQVIRHRDLLVQQDLLGLVVTKDQLHPQVQKVQKVRPHLQVQ